MATRSDRKRRVTEKPGAHESTAFYHWTIYLLGLGFGCFHRWHVSTLFENDRHFSHLSEMEREMSFRTEMGMYYSYYKTIAESENFFDGMDKLRHDNLSEYSNVIDASRKYNLLPEILAGLLYHIARNLGIISQEQCWQIERGDGLPPITSCEGLGVPVYFYLEIVWSTTVVTVAVLFYYATYLSNSIYGGFITVMFFFYNHSECTRVQWTPPLRESFAYPMLLFQMYRVTMAIRKYTRHDADEEPASLRNKTRLGLLMNIFGSTICSLCTWQFSHFVFTTQIVAILILKWLRIVPYEFYKNFCMAHALAIAAATKITNGTLIICSLYTCIIIGSNVASLVMKLSRFRSIKLGIILEIATTIILTKWIKSYVLYSQDDAHVFNILKSKLTNYRDFHTMLYTCSAEFDFLQYKTYLAIIETLLLPTAIFAGMLALYYWYRNYKTNNYPVCVEADMAYNGLQTGAFIIMAVFIMRLKLFMTPHLCIIAGAVCSKRYLEKIGLKHEVMRFCMVFGFLLCGMSIQGIDRFEAEREFIGEYCNTEQEELFEWIKSNTPKHAVFAGKMSLMANLMLSTKRPIVNNPYYENKEMRDRTMKVYEIFSRKDVASVYNSLRSMKVSYVVLEEPLCLGYANVPRGCQMIDLWDMTDNGAAKAANKPPLCPLLFKGNAYPFRRAFVNNNYVVLQLDYSHYVEFKPKTSKPLHYQF
ncbi:PREDICTED: probable C-mannosyltransferase DPY19L1 isoform X1 [Wasmannia auropunctata]|uniref:probable C-mannosyltransferase DPY19L1 isoform X1 n=1 Tax=Wasmannia auropunctata TaxID=64793 RepID=UPI0005F0288A|nr:PREDICTED: probable C-mannosyltransferase DPY19L1 isoform X1 [Wasmannia auropunctata]